MKPHIKPDKAGFFCSSYWFFGSTHPVRVIGSGKTPIDAWVAWALKFSDICNDVRPYEC